jgi:hypothetical protein
MRASSGTRGYDRRTVSRARNGLATTLTAIAQIIVGVIIQFSEDFAWVFTVTCMVGWLLSAWLFREAARA